MSTIAVPVIENLRPIDVPMIKNGPSMYLNDKKWPIDVPIKTGTPIHVPHFRKKKGPIDVPGSLILLPMFAAHPYNHFCTEYPPGGELLFCDWLKKVHMTSCKYDFRSFPESVLKRSIVGCFILFCFVFYVQFGNC